MHVHHVRCRRCNLDLQGLALRDVETVMREHFRIEHPMLAASIPAWTRRRYGRPSAVAWQTIVCRR
jgi:hypothetical protein